MPKLSLAKLERHLYGASDRWLPGLYAPLCVQRLDGGGPGTDRTQRGKLSRCCHCRPI